MFPFLMQALLDHFSYKAAVLSLVSGAVRLTSHRATHARSPILSYAQAIGYGVFGTLASLFIKERIPVPRRLRSATSEVPRRRIPTVFFRRNTFYVFITANFLASLGVLLPSVYLPSFATELGLSDQKGTLIVAMLK